MPEADVVRLALAVLLLGSSCAEPDRPVIVRESRAVEAQGRTFHVDQQHPGASDRHPGTEAKPWRTLSRATGRGVLRPGDTVVIHEGVYRESVEPREGGRPGARITFRAAEGETVVITGADLAADWRRQSDGTWRRAWTGPPLPTYSDDPVFRQEMVIERGEVLRPVWHRDSLRAGTFWAEGPPESPAALVARFREGPDRVEVAHRARLFWPLGADPNAECGSAGTPGYFRIQGLTFRHAANRAQIGAVCLGSAGSLAEAVRVEWTNARGLDVSGREHLIRQSAADYNGQMGWGGACASCVIEDSRAVGNNWKGYDPFWEAGGGKWVRTTDTVIRRFLARDNDGPGIWLDIDNADNTIEGCLAENNAIAGIALEFRTVRTLVQHNVVRGTRWVGWSGSGVISQAASHNVLLHNTITSNEGGGIWLRRDPDKRAEDEHTLVARNLVMGNVTRRDVEARELSVEGETASDVRTHTFRHNAIGFVRDREAIWRSSFFVHPTETPAGYRSDDLSGWRRLVTETGTVREAGGMLPEPGPFPRAGAIGAYARVAGRHGAQAEAVGLGPLPR